MASGGIYLHKPAARYCAAHWLWLSQNSLVMKLILAHIWLQMIMNGLDQ
jgi:hypothetical protein